MINVILEKKNYVFNIEIHDPAALLLPSPPSWTDARECILCSGDNWSNDAHDACVPKIIEFLAFGEPLGITLIVISAFGALVTIGVGVRNAQQKNPLTGGSLDVEH